MHYVFHLPIHHHTVSLILHIHTYHTHTHTRTQVQEMQSMLRKQEKSWEKKMKKLSSTYQEQLKEVTHTSTHTFISPLLPSLSPSFSAFLCTTCLKLLFPLFFSINTCTFSPLAILAPLLSLVLNQSSLLLLLFVFLSTCTSSSPLLPTLSFSSSSLIVCTSPHSTSLTSPSLSPLRRCSR